MKFCRILLFCLVFLGNLNANQSDEVQLKTLSVLGSVVNSDCKNFEGESFETVAGLLLDKQASFYCSQRFYAFCVGFEYINGFRYHVADYYDGTRVVTCLNGPSMGLQTVYLRGFWVGDSWDVNWRKRSFVHWHVSGRITSYDYKQVIELY